MCHIACKAPAPSRTQLCLKMWPCSKSPTPPVKAVRGPSALASGILSYALLACLYRLSTDTAAPGNAVDMGRSLLELLRLSGDLQGFLLLPVPGRTGAAAKPTDTSACN